MSDSKEPWCIRRPDTHKAILEATPRDMAPTVKGLNVNAIYGKMTKPEPHPAVESLRRIEEWIRQFDERVVFVHGKCLFFPDGDRPIHKADWIPREPVAATIASPMERAKRGEHRVLEIRPWVQCAGIVLSVPEPFVFEKVEVAGRSQILSSDGTTREVVLSCGVVTPEMSILCWVTWPELSRPEVQEPTSVEESGSNAARR